MEVEILEDDVPFLLGFEVLKHMRVILEFEKEWLSIKYDDWTIPLVRKLGHLYAKWSVQILFSTLQLRRLHKHFKQPAQKVCKLLSKRRSSKDSIRNW